MIRFWAEYEPRDALYRRLDLFTFEKGIMGGGKSPPPPAPAPVTVMPDPEDPAMLAEKRRRMMIESARSGRSSTILSGEYSSDTLGTR